MCRKISFLVAVVLVLSFTSSAHATAPTTELDVNNYSFELDDDGSLECEGGGDSLGIGWTIGTENWVGQDLYCACPYYCEDPEECKHWPASDGWVMCFMQTNDTWFQQYLTETIQSGIQYTLKMDAMTWDPAVKFRASIVYDYEGSPTEVAGKDIYLDPISDVNELEWKEYQVVLVVPDGHPAIDSPLGIKWWCSKEGGPNRWPFIDNIRVTSQLATDAWGPNPDDGARNVALDLEKLTWGAGLWAKTHNVYFGTNWDDVNSRDPNTLIGNQWDAEEIDVPIELVIGGEYFWAVDEYNDTYGPPGPNDPPMPPWTGPVWSFKTNDGKAYNFSPTDQAAGIAVDTTLSWTPGVAVDVHNVYFSTSFDDVESRSEDANQGYPGPNTFDPTPTGVLALGQTYYWAVDEVNADTAGSPWQSGVLKFTTIDHVVEEDFDEYPETEPDMLAVWKDTWENKTGAQVFVEKDERFTEDGNSMRYSYDNSVPPFYSEAYADLSFLGVDPNWTANGVKALRLAFMGSAGNAPDDMYVALTDGSNHTGKVLYTDSNELDKYWKGFQEWNIDLQDFVDDNGVNLTDISRLTIGFGDKTAGGTGTVYFDNIRLYPPRCVLNNAFANGSLNWDGDCLVDNADLDVFTQRDWLVSAIGDTTASLPTASNLVAHWPMDDDDSQLQVDDVSGNDNHGTLYDENKIPGRSTSSHSVEGHIATALSLDGVDDYIEVPALNLNSNTVTISAWIKRDGALPEYAGILMCYYTDPCDANLSTWAGLSFGSGGSRGFGEWYPYEVNHELAYFWHVDANDTPLYDDHAWDWHSGLIVPDDQWIFVALVVEPTQGTLYMYDGTLYASRNPLTHYPELWNGFARIGDQVEVSGRLFKGDVDDLRVYDYSLTPEEVLYIALQGAGSQYIELPWWRADYNDDNTINFTDFGVVADNWLNEILFP